MARPPPAPGPGPFDDGALPDEDPELGPPVLELLALRADARPDFHRRLTRRIERRRVAADLTTLGVTGPVTAVIEVLSGLLQPGPPAPRRRPGAPTLRVPGDPARPTTAPHAGAAGEPGEDDG